MDSNELRKRFLDFFKKNRHQIVPSSSLIPNDPSVLFTTAGMQQFKDYFLGKNSPFGANVASSQKCFRTSDIDEVGDETHLTFLEMLGNFSFGGYFKEEAIKLAHEFLFEELKIPKENAVFTVFEGDPSTIRQAHGGEQSRTTSSGQAVPPDEESIRIWQSLGVPKEKIKKYGRSDNFWGPTGLEGPCGPTTEIHINGVEVWNLVFNEYYQDQGGKLTPLKQKGVDTGMGLERLAMVVQKVPTIFETDLFSGIFKVLPPEWPDRKKRILADHSRAVAFLIAEGVMPGDKRAESVLRRLIKRLLAEASDEQIKLLMDVIVAKHDLKISEKISITHPGDIISVIYQERNRFGVALSLGLKELGKLDKNDISGAFTLYSSYGLPFEIIKEHISSLNREEFEREFEKHKSISRSGVGMFKGGLTDGKPKTIKLHTAHHLLLAALQQLFGKQVKQRGSNINSERLRIDFSFDRKLTDEEIKKLEDIVNQKIKEGLDVVRKEMSRGEAEKIGAEMEFGVKYGDTVSVYFIQDQQGNVFSKEFCGGPHVKRTSELGHFQIVKEESSGAGVRRIRAILK